MTFNIYQLDNISYDEAEGILEDYIDNIIEEFAESSVGKAYIKDRQEGGGWIEQFIELGYLYEGFTLPSMSLSNVKLIMEQIFPRKVIILDPSDAEDAIPELSAFWLFQVLALWGAIAADGVKIRFSQ